MTLAHQGTSAVLEGDPPVQKSAAVATKRRQEDLAEVVAGDAKDVRRLARQLRDEWRRERYSRLKAS
jgi:hypothetical protein